MTTQFLIFIEYIVNSGELDARHDGAKPLDNRRAIEDDITKFSSIDYNLKNPVLFAREII